MANIIEWAIVRDKVLAVDAKTGPLLDILEQYWGDGKLTDEIAKQFIALILSKRYVEAESLLYKSMAADDLLAADKAANDRLAEMIANEKRMHDFLGDLRGALLKLALGVALAAVLP